MKSAFLGLVLLAGGCAPVEPDGNGQIMTRCRSEGVTLIATHGCATGQYALCLAGTDAGNGTVLAVCCNNNLNETECAQRAGLASRDGGANQ